jgi:hypothetical protein
MFSFLLVSIYISVTVALSTANILQEPLFGLRRRQLRESNNVHLTQYNSTLLENAATNTKMHYQNTIANDCLTFIGVAAFVLFISLSRYTQKVEQTESVSTLTHQIDSSSIEGSSMEGSSIEDSSICLEQKKEPHRSESGFLKDTNPNAIPNPNPNPIPITMSNPNQLEQSDGYLQNVYVYPIL